MTTSLVPPPPLIVNLAQFPYFDDGDIQISLSPCERQLVLHSRILAQYFGVFNDNLNELTTFNDFVRSVPILSNSRLKKKRFELECSAPEEIEASTYALLVKVCQKVTH
jgi:hypothetical protein